MMGHECTIGALYCCDDVRLVSIGELKDHIDEEQSLRQYYDEYGITWKRLFTLSDYCDRRKSTNLSRFKFCPYCGKEIDWAKLKQK